MRISDYPYTDEINDGDLAVIDTPDGTKSIPAKILAGSSSSYIKSVNDDDYITIQTSEGPKNISFENFFATMMEKEYGSLIARKAFTEDTQFGYYASFAKEVAAPWGSVQTVPFDQIMDEVAVGDFTHARIGTCIECPYLRSIGMLPDRVYPTIIDIDTSYNGFNVDSKDENISARYYHHIVLGFFFVKNIVNGSPADVQAMTSGNYPGYNGTNNLKTIITNINNLLTEEFGNYILSESELNVSSISNNIPNAVTWEYVKASFFSSYDIDGTPGLAVRDNIIDGNTRRALYNSPGPFKGAKHALHNSYAALGHTSEVRNLLLKDVIGIASHMQTINSYGGGYNYMLGGATQSYPYMAFYVRLGKKVDE